MNARSKTIRHATRALVLALTFLLPGDTAASPPADARTGRLRADGNQFLLDGRPFQIISGEMHYPRIPRPYWRDRMKKARAMGLNTISTYLFWNLHEPRPGQFDFSGQLDVAEFVRTAQQEGLFVLLRPGPYVCAEWDLGGLPAWLLADGQTVLRSADEKFLRAAERFLLRAGRELAPLQSGRGGPILAVQVENEYGSFDRDKEYLGRIRDAILRAGFTDALLYTADGPAQLADGTLPDVLAVVNFAPGTAERAFEALRRFRPNQPLMSGEYWAGWFDHWGRPHHTTDAAREARELAWMLERGYSLNFYMFHGGTTFGWTNGANFDRGSYLPQTTSYDYHAALDEAGRPTPKFFAFREVIARHRRQELPPLPEAVAIVEIPAIEMNESAPLPLGKAIRETRPRTMESYGQSFGYILYRTTLEGPATGELVLEQLRDFALVRLNGRTAGTLDRRLRQDRLSLTLPAGKATLEILVENSGRINFRKELRDERKGIAGRVLFNGSEVTGWEVFPSALEQLPRARFRRGAADGPSLYRGEFRLEKTGDTFLDLRGWGKGTVWVNGHHLGRFWEIGPQQTLYLPGCWLRRGRNEVIVFALEPPAERTVRARREPVLDQLREAAR